METELIETITIESATKERDRNNNLQWAIKYNAPSISKYPMPGWLPVQNGEEIVKGDSHRAKLVRGRLKQDKDGKYKSDYYWEIAQLDTNEATPASSSGSHNDSTREGYAVGMAFNGAVHLVGQWLSPEISDVEVTHYVQHYMDLLYPLALAGPQKQASEAPEMPTEPDDYLPWDEEPEKPQLDPVAALRESARTWNHDHPDQRIGQEEIIKGLDVIAGIKTKNVQDGLRVLTPEQVLTFQNLIANGEFLERVEEVSDE